MPEVKHQLEDLTASTTANRMRPPQTAMKRPRDRRSRADELDEAVSQEQR